jgi:hypothetical protein
VLRPGRHIRLAFRPQANTYHSQTSKAGISLLRSLSYTWTTWQSSYETNLISLYRHLVLAEPQSLNISQKGILLSGEKARSGSTGFLSYYLSAFRSYHIIYVNKIVSGFSVTEITTPVSSGITRLYDGTFYKGACPT